MTRYYMPVWWSGLWVIVWFFSWAETGRIAAVVLMIVAVVCVAWPPSIVLIEREPDA